MNTSGRYFVGDFIGSFEPGNLVLTGPNLPHNWVSMIAEGERVAAAQPCGAVLRRASSHDAMALMPELRGFRATLDRSRRGLLFGRETAARVAPMLEELMGARGIRRIEIFVGIMGTPQPRRRRADPDERELPARSLGFMSAGINEALAYINENLDRALPRN